MPTLTKASSNKFVSLKSLRNLRPWFKDAASEDVQDVIDQLEKLKREKIHEEDERALRLSGHHNLDFANSTSTKTRMLYDPQDVLDALLDRFSCRMRRYRSARVKYRFLDLDGNICEWSGQGREPIKLRELLKATGKTRDDFLVNDSDIVNAQTNDVIPSKTERFYRTLEENSRNFEDIDDTNNIYQKDNKEVLNNEEFSNDINDLDDSDKDSA